MTNLTAMKSNNLPPPFRIAFSPRFLPIEVSTHSLESYLRTLSITLNRRHATGGIGEHDDGHFVVFKLEKVAWSVKRPRP